MAAGKQQQQGVVAAAAEPGAARRLWRVVRAVLYMLRRGLPSGRKLAMDLHLLLHRGKIAGKALGDLFLAFHHGRHAAGAFSYSTSAAAAPFSCRALDVHEPAPRARREVEFSCSNTPSSTSRAGGLGLLGAGKRRRRRRRQDDTNSGYLQYSNYDAAEVARMFEMLNDDDGRSLFAGDDNEPAAAATPSRAAQLLYWAVAGSPAVRSSRTTPRQLAGESAAEGVDRQADEFIRRFYEQLRAQRSAASTPDYHGVSPYVTPRARRPAAIAAGIA